MPHARTSISDFQQSFRGIFRLVRHALCTAWEHPGPTPGTVLCNIALSNCPANTKWRKYPGWVCCSILQKWWSPKTHFGPSGEILLINTICAHALHAAMIHVVTTGPMHTCIGHFISIYRHRYRYIGMDVSISIYRYRYINIDISIYRHRYRYIDISI
jgi:hypothetical protein